MTDKKMTYKYVCVSCEATAEFKGKGYLPYKAPICVFCEEEMQEEGNTSQYNLEEI
ncbi:MAG: hypothetical protein ACTSQY_11370 [Candidatus Odinarchaeia archaeon]